MRSSSSVRLVTRWCLTLVGAVVSVTAGCQIGALDRSRGNSVSGAAGNTSSPGSSRGGAGGRGASDPDAGAAPDASLTMGAWTAVKSAYLATLPDGTPGQPGTAQLLTDGRVLASGPETSNTWYTFTPDAFGSYENGTWAPAGRAAVGRLFGPGFVLPDGRYWYGGGEYVNPSPTRAESEIYDPVTATWTALPDMPQEIADTPAAALGDGRVLVVGHTHGSTSAYLLSLQPLPAWAPAAHWSRKIGDQEGGTTILQDGTVLFGSTLFQLYQPDSGTWIDAAVPPGGPGVFMAPGSDELGPMVMLLDGRALVLGANRKNGIFTPGGAGGAGAWTLTADTPAPFVHGDAPSIVEINGKVITVVTDDETGTGYGSATFFEYDPVADTWTPMNPPFTFDNAERVVLLALPNGQIWASGSGSPRAWLYTPVGTADAAPKPSIDAVAATTLGELLVTGTRLNGTTTGGDFGDDAKLATNFPIVSLSDDAGHVYYTRGAGFDVLTPAQCRSARVVVPSSIPDGTYAVHVAGSGVHEERPAQVTFAGPRVTSIVAPDAPAPGQSTSASVTLNAPAPAGGTTVELVTSDARVANVPASVVVPAGATSASFGIATAAASGSAVVRAATTNSPAFAASKTLGWSVASVVGPSGTPDGATAGWTVTLDHAAPAGGVAVGLASTNPALVSVPASVTVPEGRTSAAFTATAADPSTGTGRIYATLAGSAQSGFFGWYVTGLSGPSSAARGAATTWALSLNGPAPANGLVVALQSTDASVATVPPTITVPGGQTSTTFALNALGDPMNGTTTLWAVFGTSAVNATFQLLVTPAVSPTTVDRGSNATGTLAVKPLAPAAGLTVALKSSNTAVATVPTSVTIPAGATSATFSVAGVGVGTSNIVMTLGAWSRTQAIVVHAR